MKYPLLVLCSALLATAALADDSNRAKSAGKGTDLFKIVDADADGKISKEEAAANATFANNFSSLDGNSDGVVTEREFRRNTMPRRNRD